MTKPNQPLFPCTACGLCCQHIGHIKALKHLDSDTLQCSIYEQRPLLCRIDESYKQIYHQQVKSRTDFYKANAKVCNALQEQYGLDKHLRVKL